MFLGVYVANNPAVEVTGQKGEIDMLTVTAGEINSFPGTR